jgi:PQQ-dependent dehydrogenase (methanol/ethanol family)
MKVWNYSRSGALRATFFAFNIVALLACGKSQTTQNRSADTTAEATAALSAPHKDSVSTSLTPALGVGQVGSIPAGSDQGQQPGEWTMAARDYSSSRFSPLNDINVSNVAQLKIATTFSTGVLHGHEGNPLVVGSTMYVVTPWPNLLYAIDLTKPGGALKWMFGPNADPRSVGIACCDVVNRGATFADGKVIYNTLDAHTIAVDAGTGKAVWNTKVGEIAIGETMTMAPLVVGNKVFVGNSGAELGVRGYLAALDLGSGKILWKAYSTGPDSEVKIGPDFKPYYASDRGKDLGVRTWNGEQWKLGGGSVWGWLSYDPELKLLYYSTANPGVWNPDLRPGDNKWSMTIFARDPETGNAKWAYQLTPHDAWDYDAVNENILIDQPMNGQVRKILFHADRNGFAYTLDRATGEVLSVAPFVITNWAKGVDLKTGRPIENTEKRTHQGVVTRDICPSSTGGKDQQPAAFSPRTGLVYIPAHNVCMNYEGVEANYIAGTPYVGASVKMYPGPGGYRGELLAWDPVHQRKVCSVLEDMPLWSGVLATAGDLVFYGTMDGWFKAIDARTCTERWKMKVASGIVGAPMAYRGPDGKEYIAIYAGIGGWMGAVADPNISLDDPYTALGVAGAVPDLKQKSAEAGILYVFTL